MSQNESLVMAMAEQCLSTIEAWKATDPEQPPSLQPEHLEWMCRKIGRHAGDWPATKLHRWIGFVQGAMIANRMLTLEGAKAMFDGAKNAFGAPDADLIDHLDPDDDFYLDIGGQG
jgi:hypothetical protein